MAPLPPVLSRPPFRVDTSSLDHLRIADLRKIAAAWGVPNTIKMQPEPCMDAIRKAMRDERAALGVVNELKPAEEAVLRVYRRYGGAVHGAVVRLELLARDLLGIETRGHRDFPLKYWKTNWVEKLAARCYLISPNASPFWRTSNSYGSETQQPFPLYSLHPALMKHLTPAGPCPWRLPPLKDSPATVHRRSSAAVALDLGRVFSALTARRQLKVTKTGRVAGPALQSLAKSVPLPEDNAFPLPDEHGLYLELLRGCGALVARDGALTANPERATQLFAWPPAQQAHHWAQAWCEMQFWGDGLGSVDLTHDSWDVGNDVPTRRQILTWALSCLAQENEVWFGLNEFLSELYQLLGRPSSYGYYAGGMWDPKHPDASGKEKKHGDERMRGYWLDGTGRWFANALMITLPALGFVERGNKQGKGPYSFRLTPLGRAVFGAPEIPPPEETAGRFLVVQPNFDVVAFLEQADAGTAGFLGRIAESPTSGTDAVQTFRLTRNSIYQALENGLTAAQVVEFLRRHSQTEPPANVLQVLGEWSARREGVVLHSCVTLLGFPDQGERDGYLAKNPGDAVGERYVLAPAGRMGPRGALVRDHRGVGRAALQVDEHGVIGATTLDVVQRARLQRVAEPADQGWRVTAASVQRAAAQGIKRGQVCEWLAEHTGELPPLLELAIRAWMGAPPALALADVLLLQVPDEAHFAAISGSARLQPFLCGSPGPGWLLVRKEDRSALAKLLAELGFEVSKTLLTMPELDGTS